MTTMILLLVAAVLLLVGSPVAAFVPPTPPPSSSAAATAKVGEALGSSLRRSSPPCLGSDHEISLGTFRSDSPYAVAVPLSSRGGGRRRNTSIVRRNMFPSPRSVDGEGGGAVSGAGGGGECNWRVPRKVVAHLGAGEGDDSEEKFLPFEFDLERAPPSAGRRRVSSAAARGGGSFYFPGAAAGVVAAASSSSSDAAADPKKKEAGPSSSAATKTSSSSSSSLTQSPPRVVVRHLRESDLDETVDMCVKEFGSYSDPDDDPFRRDSTVNGKNGSSGDDRLPGYVVSNRDDGGLTLGKILEPLWTAYENWAFSWVVRIGLYMRIVRSDEGFRGGSPHDHNVLCLVEKKEGGEDAIAAIAELSLQPADPLRNAPPYVLPLSAKRAIGQKAGVGEPRAYVSNVLVRPDRRGRGYGRAVVAACEGLAQTWGCGDASLHVDADVDSGRAAQGLYRAMGYRGVVDDGAGTSKGKDRPELKWMGPEMIQKGVYVVEGVPLLYMRKKLNDR